MEKVLNSSSHSSGLSGMVGSACFANKEVMSMVGSMLAAMQANKGEYLSYNSRQIQMIRLIRMMIFMMTLLHRERIELDGKRLTAESAGIECSLGKCRMIIGEICRQKAMATP